MPDQDYTQDKGFMAASPEDQHAYLMQNDQGYAKASPEDQKAFIGHLRGQGSSAMGPGSFQTKKGGPIYNDAVKYAKDQQDNEKAGSAAAESAVSGSVPGGEFTTGAAKGAMSTGRNIGGLAIKALRYISPSLGNKAAEAWPEAINGASEAMKPQSIPAKLGFAGEQGAEFAAPGGAVTKGAKAAEAGIDAAKMAPLASKALKLLTRGGLEAASSAGVTAAQGGSGKDIAINAGTAGAMPAVGAALKPVTTALAEKVAPALANKLLRPVPTQLENAARFGRNPGQAVADEGIIATNHEDLISKIKDKKEEVGQQIGDLLKKTASDTASKGSPEANVAASGLIHKGTIMGQVHQLEHPDFPGVTAAVKPAALDSPAAARKVMADKLEAFAKNPLPNQDPAALRKAASVLAKPSNSIDAGKIINSHIDAAIKDVLDGNMEGGQGLVDRLEEMRSQLTQKRQLVDGKVQNLSPKDLNLSPSDAHALKRQIGDSAKWTGQAFDGEMNQVKRSIYRDLNSEVQKAVPGEKSLKGLQDRYGNLLEAEKAAEREAARHSSRNPFSLTDTLAAMGGLGAGALHGDLGHAAVGAAAAGLGAKAARSPLFLTTAVQAAKNSPKVVNPEFLKWARNAAFGAQSENRQ